MVPRKLAEPGNQLRANLLPQRRGESPILSDAPVDFRAMVEIVRNRCMHVGQGQILIERNLVRAPAQALMPDDNVLNRDTPADDTGSATRDRRWDFYVPVQRLASRLDSHGLRLAYPGARGRLKNDASTGSPARLLCRGFVKASERAYGIHTVPGETARPASLPVGIL